MSFECEFQRAIRQGADGLPTVVDDATIPQLPPGFALVRTIAVALNPSDNKILSNYPLPGAYVGTDFCGTVVRLADDVDSSTIQLGVRVAGAAFCFSPEHRRASGAFAEYVRAPAGLLLCVPPPSPLSALPSLGPLAATTLPTAVMTCILALWSPDALGLPGTPDSPILSEKAVPVLVYGGSTATGTIALQLLKLSGYNAISTCSPRNFDLVRDRGASAVFEYSSPDVSAKIKEHTKGRLKYVLDCISNAASMAICYEAIQRPGGYYSSLEHLPDELKVARKAVRSSFVLASEVLGEEIKLGQKEYDRPANRRNYEFAKRRVATIQRLLDQGRLRPHPRQELEGALQGVVEGLQSLARKAPSGKKLVAMID